MKTLNKLVYNIIHESLYMFTNRGCFLILFVPKDMALEENQTKNYIVKNKLFRFWVTHGLCYPR